MSSERRKKTECGYYNAGNWKPNHKNPARESTCHKCRKNRHFAKVCSFENQRQREKRNYEPKETEENDTDKLTTIITETKHVTDRRNHTTITNENEEKKLSWILFQRLQ